MSASASEITAWFLGRLPDEWTSTDPPTITVDRDEITVTLSIESPDLSEDATDADRSEAAAGRAAAFRDDTRDRRISIAREAEHRVERKVAWAVTAGESTHLFTHLAVPVMTRLRQPERLVLDTLVESNVARSRADAVAWCVRLVGRHADEWLADLRSALERVDELRADGPGTA